MIRKITKEDDFTILSQLLNDSFATVAEEFGFTKDNCPTNNAFITNTQLYEQLSEKTEFYCYLNNNHPIGFIAIEKSSRSDTTFYIEKVAVHPDYRKKGIGKILMDFAIDRIKDLGGKQISIGLIDHNTILKKWYKSQGFIESEIRVYDHLPFKVCLLYKDL